MVGSLGFEPRTASAPDWHWHTDINWDDFKQWVSSNHRAEVTRDIVNYSKKYMHCLLKRDLSELQTIRPTLRVNIVKALSNLAKYLGVHEDYKRLIKNYGLSWRGKSVDDLVIERITKTQNPDEVFTWVKQVKTIRPDLSEFMDYISITGLRLNEAIESFNLIIKLSRQGKLNEYYNEQAETLEHFRFKEMFIRKSKKCFISFVPKKLIEKIKFCGLIPNKHGIQNRIKKRGLQLRFADIREAHNTLLTKYLNQTEIDFIAGRVSSNIFISNYYNPKMISDLKERVSKGIAEIQNKISIP